MLGCVSNKFLETGSEILAVTTDDLYDQLAPSNLMEPEVTSGIDASMVVKLTLDAFTAEKLLSKKPRSLPTATFCALLIEQALDTPGMLAERAEASVASSLSSSSSKKDLNKTIDKNAVNAKKKRVRPQYDEAFTAFWNEYQRAPIKANAQSKNKAFEQWKEATKLETPEGCWKPLEGRWSRSSRRSSRTNGAHPFQTLFGGCVTNGLLFTLKTTCPLVRAWSTVTRCTTDEALRT